MPLLVAGTPSIITTTFARSRLFGNPASPGLICWRTLNGHRCCPHRHFQLTHPGTVHSAEPAQEFWNCTLVRTTLHFLERRPIHHVGQMCFPGSGVRGEVCLRLRKRLAKVGSMAGFTGNMTTSWDSAPAEELPTRRSTFIFDRNNRESSTHCRQTVRGSLCVRILSYFDANHKWACGPSYFAFSRTQM